MTDSMKFGPEWLRNMSAEPPITIGSTNSSGIGGGGNTGTGTGGTNCSISIHSLGLSQNSHGNSFSHTTAAASRNLFPEYRYGREEMLSLFDRNCFLPHILPSFKKLFVEKVQYPLALTPSSEDDISTQSPAGSSSRPAWLQRSAGGFGNIPRGTGRGGAVDRGRMRGKSVYHPLYQRPNALYEEGGMSAISAKSERNWSERNGTGDSTAVGVSGGTLSLDWNGTPTSSPRKEFSSHHRNMENWRRTRNEDGSGDGPMPGGASGIAAVDGWRSGGGGGSSNHRWGRSTSWRDEDPGSVGNSEIPGLSAGSSINMQRSFSTIATAGPDRSGGPLKAPSSGMGPVATNRQLSQKNNQSWPANSNCGVLHNASGTETEDNLPEWAMENPSELGGTFDASGAFHGESGDDEGSSKNIKIVQSHSDISKFMDAKKIDEQLPVKTETMSNGSSSELRIGSIESTTLSSSIETPETNSNTKDEVVDAKNNNDFVSVQVANETSILLTGLPSVSEKALHSSTPGASAAVRHGDISERFKEVADEMEKLIMDDDSGVNRTPRISESTVPVSGTICGRYDLSSFAGMSVKSQGHGRAQIQQHMTAVEDHSHKSAMAYSEQLAMQHHTQQHLTSTTTPVHQGTGLPALPAHVMNINELWFYRDPQSNVQGPFSAIEMTEWYRAGYFNENLFVRRYSDSRFRPLGELIKLCHGSMPFTHSHLLPLDLDNLQMAPPKSTALPHNDPQQHIRSEEQQLKANVTAAADSLGTAIKGQGLDNTQTSHMLTMRFQMLQEQYLQHQEYQIVNELSKNELFQRLTAAERESIVRSKVQTLVLPEYLSSLSGLSNSLATLNPLAGSQLYDVIAEQAKKDQQQLQHQLPGTGNFLEADDFILNVQLMHQQAQQAACHDPVPVNVEQFSTEPAAAIPADLSGTSSLDLMNEYNLRMLLRRGGNSRHQQPKPNSADFLTESQLLAGNQNLMPVWLPQQQHHQQQPWGEPQPGAPNSPGLPPIVGVPNVSKIISSTLWNVASLEEEQNQNVLQQNRQLLITNENRLGLPTVAVGMEVPPTDHDNQCQTKVESKRPEDTFGISVSSDNTDHRGHNIASCKDEQTSQPVPLKQMLKQQHQKNLKLNEEERRRELAEEKRRTKEERKRLQLEDEKKRALLAEEERCRQMKEEKERQQQIQAQRRKALLGNDSTIGGQQTNKSGGNKINDAMTDQQTLRSQSASASSIAPWSLQSPSVSSAGPDLAEIQKAERRERRADQQRQQEQLDKQLRANAAAAAEANDALLKWQASPAQAPVMSLAEIQAEEAKHLNELLEQQRRREQEQQQQQAALAASLGVGSSSGGLGLSNIWGNVNKAWSGISAGPQTISSGFWEDSSKFQAGGSGGTNTVATIVAGGPTKAQHLPKTSAVPPASLSTRNLRKSQTLPVIHNSTNKNSKAIPAGVHQDKTVGGPSGKALSGPGSSKTPKLSSTAAEGEKKGQSTGGRLHQNSSNDAPFSVANKKITEYENEFTNWCMKSLVNMSAKVDVPTFVAFLQDLEAPYEVKDYVRIYLGEGKEPSDFAKQFLERRSKYKNLQRAQNAHNDDMCKPAPAITPSSNDSGENKNKQKKVKKNKMTKMDARILGFSVTAAEGRINVGVRDYGDAP